MKAKFSTLILTFLTVAAVPVFSRSPEELIGAERAAALRASDETITEVQTRNPGPKLLPKHDELQIFITQNMKGLEPNIMVESLFLYRKPPQGRQASGQAGKDGKGWSEAERTGLFNRTVSLSTLAGIQYYSESRKSMRVFYELSHIINNPENKIPLPDPVYNTVPASLTLYARQKDLTFGENIYRFDYFAGADSIFFVQENLTPMTAGIIPAVGKNNLKTVFALIDTGDSLLLYVAAMAKTASIPGMGDRIGASFSNRAKAVIKWFTAGANGILGG